MPTKSKIIQRQLLSEILENRQKAGESIVFTNGCFDLMHLGHVDYLEKARSLGDALVVGVNSDRSVREIKGASRPIVDETSRSRVLAALEFVDYVVLFDESTPLRLIEALKPNVLVKGEDYEIKDIVGAQFVLDHGGRVERIAFVPGYSTSSIEKKIKDQA